MKLFLSNYHYRAQHSGGGHLHIEAFIQAARHHGHRLYAKPSCAHPAVHPVRPDALGQWWHLRDADLHYIRLEDSYPRHTTSRWFTPPLRRFIPRPLLVWEFNTIPEQGVCNGLSAAAIAAHKANFRRAAPGCDLAVCVSEAIATYAREELGVRDTLVIPNGGELRPAPAPPAEDTFNVIWAGTACINWHAFDVLLASARALLSVPSARPIRFHLYGSGTETIPDLPANVIAHGPAAHATVAAAYARTHVGLCLYRPGPGDYSSPLKFYDGLAAGLPMITSPHPQMDAVQAELGASRLIVTDWRPAELTRILLELAADEPLRLTLAARAHQLARSRYNWPDLMGTLFTRLESLVRQPRPSRSG